MTKNTPKTHLEEVRQTLNKLEYSIAKLDEITQHKALEIPVLFDRAFNGFEKLRQIGANFASEEGVFETLSAQFRRKLKLFLKKSGGVSSLEHSRQHHQPDPDRWWWYADQILADYRRKINLRWVRNIAAVTILLLIVITVYQRFFAPDPVFTASVGHQNQAEILLINLEFDQAYQEVQNALAYTPNKPDLLVLKGVLEELLEQPDDAAESYAFAKDQFDNQAVFFTQRSIYYIMAGLLEPAIEDSKTALEINPDSVTAYLNLGQAYQDLGDFQTAYEYLELADQAAQRTGNVRLQAIARVQMSQVLQQLSMATPIPLETQEE